MGDLFATLIELVARIWHADSELRNRSPLGESEFVRGSRHFVALLSGGTIAVLAIIGLVSWWFTRKG
jgi:predicted small integral membrane protein